MNWTKELPTKPGFYAWRFNNAVYRELFMVCEQDGELFCIINAFNRKRITELADREWIGPLPD